MSTETVTETQMSTSTDPEMADFHEHLLKSERILALCGAGLSASSGLPTFRGAGGFWRNHDATTLATTRAFDHDPGLVWMFYAYRRHMALTVKPNKAHYALAELARKKPSFRTISQNVDGLSPRANHPPESLHLLHGSLFDIKCRECNYVDVENFSNPLCPSLAAACTDTTPIPYRPSAELVDRDAPVPTRSNLAPNVQAQVHLLDPNARTRTASSSSDSASQDPVNIHDPTQALNIDPETLPRCPECKSLLRPGVVFFGESLPHDTIDNIEDFIDESPSIDLIMVIGTSAQVYPAAGYIEIARANGARVAVVNMDDDDGIAGRSLVEGRDWYFQGDAAVLVPEMLRPVTGDVEVPVGGAENVTTG